MDGQPLKGLQGLSLSYDDVGRATLILKLRPERVRIVSSDLDAVGVEGAKVTVEHWR